MAREFWLWLFLGNAVFVVIYGTSVPVTCTDERDGTSYEVGDTWSPDPCTQCECSAEGRSDCFSQACLPPRCQDYSTADGECCPSCPNGENCAHGDTIIPNDGSTHNLDSGEECYCEETDYGQLEAVCSQPPPTSCEGYDGTMYGNGETWKPDACTWCTCRDGEPECMAAAYQEPRCVDSEQQPDECFPTCPNGENCEAEGTVIPYGESRTLENGQECWCEEGDYGGLEAVCNPPPAAGCEATETWQPDPCTWCFCENGEPVCAMASCAFLRCVDQVDDPDQCCPYCPNGPNCQYNGIIIAEGATVTLEDGQVCSCQGDEWGPLEAVCVLPPPNLRPKRPKKHATAS